MEEAIIFLAKEIDKLKKTDCLPNNTLDIVQKLLSKKEE